MSTFTAIPFALSVIAVLIALAFVYLRKHPDAVQSVESEWTKIHTKLDNLLAHVQATHAAALAPVTVALVPVSTPPAAAEVAPAAAAPTVTDRLFGGGGQGAAAPAAPAGPGYDDYADVIDWTLNGAMGSSLNWRFRGPNGRKTFTVPDGYVGHVRIFVTETPESKGGNGFVCTVNGLHPRQQPSGNSDFTHDIYIGMEATDGDVRDVAGTPGTYTYDMQCEGGGLVNLRHYP